MSSTILLVSIAAAIIFISLLISFNYLRKRFAINKASEDVLKGRDKEAEKKLLDIIDLEEDNYEAYQQLVSLYMKNKKYKDALKILDKALNKAEVANKWDQKEILLLSAFASKQIKKRHAAHKYFMTVLGMDANNSEALKNMAILEFEFEEFAKAENYFNKCYAMKDKIKFDKDFVRAFAFNNYELGKYKDTIKILSSYLDKYPKDYEANYYMGMALYYAKDEAKAVQFLKHGIYVPKKRAEAFFTLGLIYMNKEKFDEAYSLFKKIEKLKGVNQKIIIETYYNLGDILIAKNKIEESVIYWEKISKIRKHYKDVDDKLQKFSKLTANDDIRYFSLTGKNEFIAISKRLINKLIGSNKVDNANLENENMLDILVSKQVKYKNLYILFRFVKDTTVISENTVKDLNAKMKQTKSKKAVLISIGDLSKAANDYISARPIEYVDKKELSKLLKSCIRKG